MDEATQTEVSTEASSSPLGGESVSPDPASAPASDGSSAATAAASVAESDGGEAGAPFIVPETDDDLKDLNGQRHVEALIQTRTHARALQADINKLKPLESWQPVSERFGSPDEVLTYAELGKSLFTPVEKDGEVVLDSDGLPQTTALPFLFNVFKQSPEQGMRLLGDAMDIRLKMSDGRVDTAFNLRLAELGLDPSKLQQYAEWTQTGAPVATSGVDLSKVPQTFHEAVKALPARLQEDISALANAEVPDDELLNYYLNDAQAKFDDRRARAEAGETQRREAQAAVERNTQAAVQGKLETGVDQFLQHLSEWKPTADDGVNRAYHLETASSLLNLLDPGMAKINNLLFETLKMQPDPEIPKLNQQFQQQTGLAEYYKSIGETLKSGDALRSADSAYTRLVAKLNGVAGKLIEHKSKVASASEQAAAADGQRGRVDVTGRPGAPPQNGGNPNWIRNYYD